MRFSAIFLAVLSCTSASAALAEEQTLTLERLTGPLSFVSRGRTYVLSDLYAPAQSQPLAPWQGKSVLLTIEDKPDRWQRLPARSPLVQDILTQGLAQLQPIDRPAEANLLAAEDSARLAGRGLWAQACCALLSPGTAQHGLNQWRIIRGTVLEVTARKDTTYLNFGPDWRTDFTIMIPARLARQIETASLPGKAVEVRGMLEWSFGPAIKLTHAAQMRLLQP